MKRAHIKPLALVVVIAIFCITFVIVESIIMPGSPLLSGRSNHYLRFNGTSADVEVPYSEILDIEKNELTMSAWVRSNTTRGQQIFEMANSGNSSDRKYGMYLNANRLGCEIQTVDGKVDQITGSIPTGTWAHLVCTYDGSKVTWYINGLNVGTESLSGNLVSRPMPLHIGSFKGSSNFVGDIDTPAIYSVSKTPEQISDIQRGKLDIDGAAVLLTLDEGRGITTADSSGNNNIGNLRNGPLWMERPLVEGILMYDIDLIFVFSIVFVFVALGIAVHKIK